MNGDTSHSRKPTENTPVGRQLINLLPGTDAIPADAADTTGLPPDTLSSLLPVDGHPP